MLGPDHARSIRDEFVNARYHHQDNNFDHKPLAAALSKALSPSPELQKQIDLEAGAAPVKRGWKAPKPVQTSPAAAVPVAAVVPEVFGGRGVDESLVDPYAQYRAQWADDATKSRPTLERFPELAPDTDPEAAAAPSQEPQL